MILDFKQYFYSIEEELIIEAEIDYSAPQTNNKSSDWDRYGGYNILSLEVFHEDGEPYLSNKEHQNKLLDNEIRDSINQQLRCMEISDSRFDENSIDKEFERSWIGED